MRFTWYTEKTVTECIRAINERSGLKATANRPSLEAQAEKGGNFTLAASSKVFGRFLRTTYLSGTLTREGGVTIVKGMVSQGMSKENQWMMMGVLAIIGLLLLFNGDLILGILAVILGAALYIPLRGDHENSEFLLKELRLALKAKDTPPKKADSKKTLSRSR